MNWIKSVGCEVLGLFVDDGSFAVAILIWLAFGIVGLPRIGLTGRWTGPIFFVGLAIILIESVLRFSHRRTK